MRSIGLSAALIAATCVACADDPRPDTGFNFEAEGATVPVVILRSADTTTALGYRVALLDLFLPAQVTEADARATLQRVIDSVAQIDTLAAAVRVVGYMMGEYDPESNSAELDATISGYWSPTDSIGITGSDRSARFRTNFIIMRPFTTGAEGNQ
jgi:hypothetical protein